MQGHRVERVSHCKQIRPDELDTLEDVDVDAHWECWMTLVAPRRRMRRSSRIMNVYSVGVSVAFRDELCDVLAN